MTRGACYGRPGYSCRPEPIGGQRPGEEEVVRCPDCTGTYLTGYLVPARTVRTRKPPPAPATPASEPVDFRGAFLLACIAAAVVYVTGLVNGWW